MSIIVIKYGGSLLEEPRHRAAFLKDVAALFKKQDIILVHGGGKEISRQMEQAGLQPKFVNGRRYTDEATMMVVKKALSHLNNEIIAELGKLGVPAIGRSGQEDHLMEADVIQELGRVGIPKKVNPVALEMVLKKKAMPVFYSVAEDSHHQSLNINADDFALELAVACQARHLVFLTDVGAILNSEAAPFNIIWPEAVEEAIRDNVIKGGMIIKARACVDAMKRGVHQVSILKSLQFLLENKIVPEDGTSFMHQPPQS
jgi:acetylglutamate kinase